MKDRKTIFLHSMFRAGSTYIFNKFRSYDHFYTYYEPLHHDLIKLKKESLDIWKFDKKTTDIMNHPELKKPHFYEFQTAFNDDNDSLPYYDTDFAYKEFFEVQKSNELKLYINNLIETAPENMIPILQFNRTSMRIDWFKQNYNNSFNIFLLRNPRDQFESYYQRGPVGKNIFLAINLYIILANPKASDLLFNKKINFTFTDDILIDLSTCQNLSKKFRIEDHYKFFYYIWVSSFKLASDHADFILDMDRMNFDEAYLEDVKSKIFNYAAVTIEFQDYKIKSNSKVSINFNQILKIEKMIHELNQYDNTFKTRLDTYLNNLGEKESVDNLSFLKNSLIRLGNLIRAK